MEKYKTDCNNPPPFQGCAYYERSCDPFAPGMMEAAIMGTPEPDKTETGWLAIDWIENPVGFIPDGTEFDMAIKPDAVIQEGYFADDRMFAYPKDPTPLNELLERHLGYKQEKSDKAKKDA